MDFRACFTASVFYASENLIGDVLNIETAIGGAVISQDRFWQFVKTHLLERSLFFYYDFIVWVCHLPGRVCLSYFDSMRM